jgi:hypothetical protein
MSSALSPLPPWFAAINNGAATNSQAAPPRRIFVISASASG